MPHCIVEYSKEISHEIEMGPFMADLKQVMVKSELFNPDAIKVRAIAYEDYLLSSQYDFFIHIQLKILEGRTPSQKEDLSKAVHEYALSRFEVMPVALSTEVIDMERNSYQKR